MTVVTYVDIIMLEFEWDENKNQVNIRRRGISFQEASRIFRLSTLDEIDDREDYGETRIASIGEADGRILYVVYTWRNNVIRIISARRANRHERRKYSEIYQRGN